MWLVNVLLVGFGACGWAAFLIARAVLKDEVSARAAAEKRAGLANDACVCAELAAERLAEANVAAVEQVRQLKSRLGAETDTVVQLRKAAIDRHDRKDARDEVLCDIARLAREVLALAEPPTVVGIPSMSPWEFTTARINEGLP